MAVKNYTNRFRKEVIEYQEEHGSDDTLKKYNIPSELLERWVSKSKMGRFSWQRGQENVGRSISEFSEKDIENVIAYYKANGAKATQEKFDLGPSVLFGVLHKHGVKLNNRQPAIKKPREKQQKQKTQTKKPKKPTYESAEIVPPPPDQKKQKVFVVYGEDPAAIAEVLKGLK